MVGPLRKRLFHSFLAAQTLVFAPRTDALLHVVELRGQNPAKIANASHSQLSRGRGLRATMVRSASYLVPRSTRLRLRPSCHADGRS